MDINEILSQMESLVGRAETENRSLTDEEVTTYEGLESTLKSAQKTAELRARTDAYSAPNVIVNAVGGGKGDEVLERAFEHYLRTGTANQDITELRAQGTGGNDTTGGYTVPDGFLKRLVEVQEAFGGLRSVADVIKTSTGEPVRFPTLDDTANEGAITPEHDEFNGGADLVFGNKTLGAFKYTTTGDSDDPLRVSVELLQDSAFDVSALVAKAFGKRIARAQAKDFTNGVGTTEPLGLMTTTSDLNNGGTTITYAKLLSAYHTVDPEYRDGAVWVMNDSTLAEIEGVVDTTGRPVLNANFQGISEEPSAGRLLGKRIVVDNGVVTTSGYNVIAFGDMNESYIIRDVQDLTVVVNPYSRANYGEVEYVAWARADGTIKNRGAYSTIKNTKV